MLIEQRNILFNDIILEIRVITVVSSLIFIDISLAKVNIFVIFLFLIWLYLIIRALFTFPYALANIVLYVWSVKAISILIACET